MFGVSHTFSLFVFLKSIGIGYLLGCLYFGFKLLRFFGLRHAVLVFFQDILFFLISAIIVFLFVFEINAGVFRFYIFTGILVGYCIVSFFTGIVFARVRNGIKNRKNKRNNCGVKSNNLSISAQNEKK
mgnify:CR=1 FL=1